MKLVLGVRWAGMVFGRLVWSFGVMAVVGGIGDLWGPGRDCHEMNHISERPLLVVFEVPNCTLLNDLIIFSLCPCLGGDTSNIFNFLRVNRFPLFILEYGVPHAHWGILFLEEVA